MTDRIVIGLGALIVGAALLGSTVEAPDPYVHGGDKVYGQVVDDAATPDPYIRPTVTPSATPSRSAPPTASPRTSATPRASRAARSTPSWIRVFAECVIDHESRNWPYDGNPRPYDAVRSDGGTASGAYQFIDSTWRTVSRKAGHPGYARAHLAPPAVQDAVFAWTVLHEGPHHWAGTGCGHGT
jgi:hypothetical protein